MRSAIGHFEHAARRREFWRRAWDFVVREEELRCSVDDERIDELLRQQEQETHALAGEGRALWSGRGTARPPRYARRDERTIQVARSVLDRHVPRGDEPERAPVNVSLLADLVHLAECGVGMPAPVKRSSRAESRSREAEIGP